MNENDELWREIDNRTKHGSAVEQAKPDMLEIILEDGYRRAMPYSSVSVVRYDARANPMSRSADETVTIQTGTLKVSVIGDGLLPVYEGLKALSWPTLRLSQEAVEGEPYIRDIVAELIGKTDDDSSS